MIQLAIVEDETEQRTLIINYLKEYEKDKNESFVISSFSDGIDILDDYSADYDIIFLDINMKHMNGMDTAVKIRQSDSEVVIIFITSLAQYAIAGYKVNALDFILKPVKENQLFITLDRALANIRKWKKEKLIRVSDGNGIRKISTEDIHLIEVLDHDLSFVTKDGVITTKSGSLHQYEEELSSYSFVRANQSQLVNLKYIEEIKGDEVIMPSCSVFLSRNRKKEFLKKFAGYFGMGE